VAEGRGGVLVADLDLGRHLDHPGLVGLAANEEVAADADVLPGAPGGRPRLDVRVVDEGQPTDALVEHLGEVVLHPRRDVLERLLGDVGERLEFDERARVAERLGGLLEPQARPGHQQHREGQDEGPEGDEEARDPVDLTLEQVTTHHRPDADGQLGGGEQEPDGPEPLGPAVLPEAVLDPRDPVEHVGGR
jgi:hypothetical protein